MDEDRQREVADSPERVTCLTKAFTWSSAASRPLTPARMSISIYVRATFVSPPDSCETSTSQAVQARDPPRSTPAKEAGEGSFTNP